MWEVFIMLFDKINDKLKSLLKNQEDDDEYTQQRTRIFDKEELPLSIMERPSLAKTVFTILEGQDRGKVFIVEKYRINIGRMINNEVVLSDSSVSRLHAYIVHEDDKRIIYDAGSLNGILINDKSYAHCVLHNGDIIKLGNTVIKYEQVN